MNYNYKIIPELQIILGVHFGITKYEDLAKMKTSLAADPVYNPGYSVIADLGDTEFILSDEERTKYVALVKKIGNLSKPIKTALITSTPNQVVNATFYSVLGKELPINFLIVSSVDTAINFLRIPKEKHQTIKDELARMKLPFYKTHFGTTSNKILNHINEL